MSAAPAAAFATKVHARFWNRMSESFGEAWAQKHGEAPTVAWCKLVDEYPASTLRDCLARMREQKWEYPPSLPVFATYLAKIHSGSTAQGPDHVAGYWRSVILSAVLRDGAVLFQVWSFGANLRDLTQAHAHAVVYHIDALTTEIAEMERRTGQRTAGMQEHAQARIEKFLRALKAGSTPAERSA